MIKKYIPKNWQNKIKTIRAKNGLSPAQTSLFETDDACYYLKSVDNKFSNTTFSVKREKEVMEWLKDKLSVPKVVDFSVENGREFLVMSQLKGKGIDGFKRSPEKYITHLANAIKLLHSVDIKNCPFDSGLDIRLAELKYLIDNGLASIGDWEPTTQFSNTYDFYQWLCDNKPSENLVFSHGDVTANMFIEGLEYNFYDLGRAGVADKWVDIAFCVREIYEYKNKKYEDMFFDLLNIEPNYKKIEYFILLDEMF